MRVWEIRLGRKMSKDGSSAEAFVAHILDDAGQPVRSRWFDERDEAERWAKDNHALGRAVARSGEAS